MEQNSITVVFNIDDGRIVKDIEIPLDITANELITVLNNAYALGMDTNDIDSCYLRSEDPVALIRGEKLLSDFGLHTATTIFYRKRSSAND